MKQFDLVYFGYKYDKDSKKHETDFINEIKENFPNVQLRGAYDSFKGYRQAVYLDESDNDNYLAWIIAFGWSEFSMTCQLMFMDSENKEKLDYYIKLAKSQYSQNFKD